MKKVISLITVFFVCAVVACAVCLAGCSSEDDVYVHIIDFEKCEIGYEVPVHPDCEFNYELSDGHIIQMEKITAVLSDKTAEEDSLTVSGDYAPYTITISAHGHTDKDLSGKNLEICFRTTLTNFVQSSTSKVDENGDIFWDFSIGAISTFSAIYFRMISY